MTDNPTTLTFRRLGRDDQVAVETLAELDSSHVPEYPLIGVEVEGRLLAAASVATGETVADPFSRTEELRELLATRTDQLRRRDRQARPGLRHRTRSRRAVSAPAPATTGGPLTLHTPAR
jgi:hypothetical protein